jgi:hypothetical protein
MARWGLLKQLLESGFYVRRGKSTSACETAQVPEAYFTNRYQRPPLFPRSKFLSKPHPSLAIDASADRRDRSR